MALNRGLLEGPVINAGKCSSKIHATFGKHMLYLITGVSRLIRRLARYFSSFWNRCIECLRNSRRLRERVHYSSGKVVIGSVAAIFTTVEVRSSIRSQWNKAAAAGGSRCVWADCDEGLTGIVQIPRPLFFAAMDGSIRAIWDTSIPVGLGYHSAGVRKVIVLARKKFYP